MQPRNCFYSRVKINFFYAIVLSSVYYTALAQPAGEIKLKDYNPVSIYKIPVSQISKAKYPVIDFHSHDYPNNDQEVDTWIRTMNEAGIATTIILTYATGKKFDSIADKYARYKNRFEVWCGIDYTGFEKPDWEQRAVAELERCFRKGARGVGEMGDKGLGELYSTPTPGYGVHIDNPRMKPILQKCATLRMPVSIHVAEDLWMYENDDAHNDGLMNSSTWKVDMTKEGILTHGQLIKTLENAVRDNPKTTFIACHLANTCADLSLLGNLFDKYPNLYADIAARYGELAPVPRHVRAFFEKYSRRLVYGTDMGFSKGMYEITFRILESADEHFYAKEFFNYHWPLHALQLSPQALENIYNKNGKKILTR